MRKKKVKLTKDQKRILLHLEWYVKNKITWVGDQDLREAVAESIGWHAVFSIRGESRNIYERYWVTECFDTLIMADDKAGAMAIVNWNPSSHSLVVNLRWFGLVEERRRLHSPEIFIPDDLG